MVHPFKVKQDRATTSQSYSETRIQKPQTVTTTRATSGIISWEESELDY